MPRTAKTVGHTHWLYTQHVNRLHARSGMSFAVPRTVPRYFRVRS